MRSVRPPSLRLASVIALAATLLAAVPLPVHHHADHPDEALHLEQDHGGHGGLLEQDEAQIPGPESPALPRIRAHRLPGTSGEERRDPAVRDFLAPRSRAPPANRPRAPPLPS